MSKTYMKADPIESSTTNRSKLYHEARKYDTLRKYDTEFHFHVPVF